VERALSLISGGIDSAVASYILLDSGFDLVFVNFNYGRFSDTEETGKTERILRLFSNKFGKRMKLYVVKHEKNLKEMLDKVDLSFFNIVNVRVMHRIATEIAKKEKIKFIVKGDSLAQVASQTLENLGTEYEVFRKNIVLHPLISLDKLEIEKIAREIGTYEISIDPAGECCNITPEKPRTRATVKEIKAQELGLDIGKMVKRSLQEVETRFIG